jgi:hypothetical protein
MPIDEFGNNVSRPSCVGTKIAHNEPSRGAAKASKSVWKQASRMAGLRRPDILGASPVVGAMTPHA